MLPGGWDRSGPKRGIGQGTTVSYDAGVRGDYNAHWKALGQNLVDYNLGDSIVRLGGEFNGGWYAWRASDNPSQWAAYWRQFAPTMRGVRCFGASRKCFVARGEKSTPRHFHTRCRLRPAT